MVPIIKTASKLGKDVYALLPNASRPRLAVRVDKRSLFQNGITTYKPGKRISRIILTVARLIGPISVYGEALKIPGDRKHPSLAIRIAQLISPYAEISAIFFGSPGETNTALIKIVNNRESYYAKVPCGKNAAKYVLNEASSLRQLEAVPLKGINVPVIYKVLDLDGTPVLVTREVTNSRSRQSRFNLSVAHSILYGMSENTSIEGTLLGSDLGRRVTERLEKLGPIDLLVSAWNEALRSTKDIKLPLSLGHGDFVPWNILEHKGEHTVLDWEWSADKIPPAIDLVHYITQGSINLKGEPVSIDELVVHVRTFLESRNIDTKITRSLIKSYLVDWITFEISEGGKSLHDLDAHTHLLRSVMNH